MLSALAYTTGLGYRPQIVARATNI